MKIKNYDNDAEEGEPIEDNECPYCKCTDVSRYIDCWGESDNYIIVDCNCNGCDKHFTAYYTISEVRRDEEDTT